MIAKKRRMQLVALIYTGVIRSAEDFDKQGLSAEESIFAYRIIRPDNNFGQKLEDGLKKIIENEDKESSFINQDTEIEVLAYDTSDTEQIDIWTTVAGIEEKLIAEEAENDTSVTYDVFVKTIAHIELDEYIRIGEFSADNGFEFIDTLD